MKLMMRSIGQVMIPADVVNKQVFSTLQDGVYQTTLSFAKFKDDQPDEVRSLAQNRLLHGWHEDQARTDVNEHAGKTPEEWKDEMKYLFLFDMYVNSNYDGFADIFMPMAKHYTPDQFEMAKWQLIKKDWIRTRGLPVAMFRQYLDKIEKFCVHNGIVLRTDPTTYKVAMGCGQEKQKRGKKK